MAVKLTEFQDYLKIDRSALDDEVMEQPSLFYSVGEAHAEAIAKRDFLKEAMATTDAELSGIHREAFIKQNIKPTEKMVENAVLLDKDHEQAFALYIKAKEQSDKLWALKEAFAQRKDMLHELARLHASNYFESTSAGSKAYERQRAELGEARAVRNRLKK